VVKLAVLAAAALVACGPRAGRLPAHARASSGEVTLYRDRALVHQRVDVDVPRTGPARVRVRIAAGVRVDEVHVVERDRFAIAELRQLHGPASATAEARELGHVLDGDDAELEGASDDAPATPPPVDTPTELELVVGAPRPGRYTLHLGYVTPKLPWDAAYVVTTTAARERAVLRGALVIRNATGIALPGVRVRVIDAELAAAGRRARHQLVEAYLGAAPATTPEARPRDLGRVDLVDGETRVELLPGAAPRPMRSVLVYDPIGTSLDRTGAAPVRDPALGVYPPAGATVTESFELERDARATAGLPAGPVRLLEQRADGTLALLGEARLFDAATQVADADTIPIGAAAGVSGARERREYTLDEARKRLVEELVITLENTRDRPVEVAVREHLYRGQNWTLAYGSAPIATQEGPQQIQMRTTVPARGRTQVLYVVVYTW